MIKEVLGHGVVLIDSAKQVAIEVKKILAAEGLLNAQKKGKEQFYVSDNPEWFASIARRFLGRDVKRVSKVNL